MVKLQDYRYAFVDRQGRALNNELFSSATSFKNGTAIVRKLDSGHGILRSDGSYAISCIEVPNKIDTYIKEIWSDIFLYSKTFYKKPSYVDHKDQYLVNRNGSYILNQPIDEVIEIKDNYIKIRLGKRIGEIDFSGKFLSRPFRTKVDLGNGLFRVRDVEYGWGIFDENIDEIIIPCKYSKILFYKPLQIFILQPFGDGHRSFPCSIVNRKNEVIIPPKYDIISILEHKYIQASYWDRERGCGLKSGIIDLQGNELVKPKYGHIWPSESGFMVAEFEGRCGYVDSNGLSNLEYDSYNTVYLSEWDCSSISFGDTSYDKGEKYPPYSETFSCKPTFLIVSNLGKYGVVDLNNTVIVPLIYDSITSVNNSNNKPGYYIVKQKSKFGVLNLNGEIIIPAIYVKITSHRESEDDFIWSNKYSNDDSDYSDTLQRMNQEMEEYDRYLDSIKGKQLYFECTDFCGETIFLDNFGNAYLPHKKKKLERVQPIVPKVQKPTTINKTTPIKKLYLFFDTETTGVPNDYNAPSSDLENWPRLVQIAWVVADENGDIIRGPYSEIIKPSSFIIPQAAIKVHGISQDMATKEGKDLSDVLYQFTSDLKDCTRLIGHNISFDIHIVSAEFLRLGKDDISYTLESLSSFCTMKSSVNLCRIPGHNGYKYPKLSELYRKLFGDTFENAHDACADILATLKCYFELRKRNIF